MTGHAKRIDELQISDFLLHPLWQYVNDGDFGEMTVRPVDIFPVNNLYQMIIGTRVRLANDCLLWACIGNVDCNDPVSTEHFLTISLEHEGKWFPLARYHDVGFAEFGPDSFAKFLHLNVDDVFPISYDITRFAYGNPQVLRGNVLKEPRRKLSPQEVIDLSLKGNINSSFPE